MTVGSRKGRAKTRLNQAFTGNRRLAADLNGKINIVYSELLKKFETLREHIKKLDGQVVENAVAIMREIGCLPGRIDTNPKCQTSAVTLRSEKRLTPKTKGGTTSDELAEIERTRKTISNQYFSMISSLVQKPLMKEKNPTNPKRSMRHHSPSMTMRKNQKRMQKSIDKKVTMSIDVQHPLCQNRRHPSNQ